MARIARGAVIELTAEIDDLHDGSPAMRNADLRSDRFDVGFGGKCQTSVTGNSLCSPAPQLRLKPIAQRSRKWRPGLLKPAELPDVMTIQAAQLLLDGRKIDAGGFSLADDGTPIDDDIAHQGCVASREQELQRVDSHDPVAVEAIEIDHNKVRRRPRSKHASPGRAGCLAPVADGEAEKFG